MKLRKKILFLTLCICMLTVSVPSSFALSEEKNDSYQQLSTKGFPKDFLNCITEEMMMQVLSRIENAEAFDVLYGDDRAKSPSDAYSPMSKTVRVVLKNARTGEITGECICVYWEWQSRNPIIRQEDRLKIRWYNEDLIYDGESFYAEDYQIKNGKINVSETYTTLAHTQNANDVSPAEISYFTNLKYSGSKCGGAFVFDLIPTKPLNSGETVRNKISLEYVHHYKRTVVIILTAETIALCAACCIAVLRRKRKSATACAEPGR